MDPATILLIAQLLEQAITYAPALAVDLQKLFASGKPTPADFAALYAAIQGETYALLVPNTQLPPATLAQ